MRKQAWSRGLRFHVWQVGRICFIQKVVRFPVVILRWAARLHFHGMSTHPPNGYLAQQVSKSCFDTGIFLSFPSTTGLLTQDPQGVGPPQNWFVQGETTTPFHFEFGVKGEYGAPRDLDGMVLQVYATWVNGLTPGRYYACAWVFRYVQSVVGRFHLPGVLL